MGKHLAIASIRNNETGEVRRCSASRNPEYDDSIVFWWTEGNGACDCNKATFFAEAGGEPDPNCDCGDDGYTVLRVTDENGEVLYAGDEEHIA